MRAYDLPSPATYGLPSKFTEWRTHQPTAIMSILTSDRRFKGLTAPVGSGKSLTAIAAAVIGGLRVLYLTSSKGLQSQLMHDFAQLGVVDIRGKNNYRCAVDRSLTCDQGPCVAGLRCELRGVCEYWAAVKKAVEARVVVSNYSFWMASQRAQIGLGRFDMIVADEAHSADEVVSRFLEVVLRKEDMRHWWPGQLGGELRPWVEWAEKRAPEMAMVADDMAQDIKDNGWTPRAVREYTKMKGMADAVDRVAHAGDSWIVEEEGSGLVRIGPLWPSGYMEGTVWRGVGRVLLMSATLNAKTMDLLGVGEDERSCDEYPHSFPVRNRPVIVLKTGVRLNYRTPEIGVKKLMRVMDQIIDWREDRNGLVHTVSYARRDMYVAQSRHKERIMTHTSRDTERMVWEFKRRGQQSPLVFVSPSVTTGYDFPGREAEFQIAMKVPYPDTTNKLVAARCKEDGDYASYVAMMEMVQMSGRIVRTPEDVGETFIIDDTIGWFMKEYGKELAPAWFREAIRWEQVIPSPPERMAA